MSDKSAGDAPRHLRSGIIISVPITRDLSFPAHVMIGNCLPPYSRLCHLQLRQFGQHAILALRVQQIDPDWRVVALHQINQIQHPHKCYLYDKERERGRDGDGRVEGAARRASKRACKAVERSERGESILLLVKFFFKEEQYTGLIRNKEKKVVTREESHFLFFSPPFSYISPRYTYRNIYIAVVTGR